MLSNLWAPAIIAYGLGLLTGWVIWGVAKSRAVEDNADKHAEGNGSPGDGSQGDGGPDIKPPVAAQTASGDAATAKLNAIEDEITAAKSILEADADEQAVIADNLASLDDAVKRANGRLKLIQKSIKRGKDSDSA